MFKSRGEGGREREREREKQRLVTSQHSNINHRNEKGGDPTPYRG